MGLRVLDPMQTQTLCTAHSKRTGKPCTNHPIAGATVCRMHGGSAPQVKAAAAERIKALAPSALDVLEGLLKSDMENIQLAAARDLLDRAGFGAKQKLEAEHSGPDGGPIRTEQLKPEFVADVLRVLREDDDQEASGSSL